MSNVCMVTRSGSRDQGSTGSSQGGHVIHHGPVRWSLPYSQLLHLVNTKGKTDIKSILTSWPISFSCCVLWFVWSLSLSKVM